MSDKLANYYRIEKALGFLMENFRQQPDLADIASKVHMSPFHFQRIFTDWVGISPKKFVQYLTLDYLREKIRDTENMMDAADAAGLSSQSRVNELFVKIEGVSPQQYKSSGKGLEIFYGYHASPFGLCFIAVAASVRPGSHDDAHPAICALKFIDEEKSRDEFREFSAQWQFATLIHKPEFTQQYVKKIFSAPGGIQRQLPGNDLPPSPGNNLQLLVKGTDFQVKVWEALLQIPFGSVTSFQQVARIIGRPDAARAVGSAVGANHILYLIPCHRVISTDGTMGNYHFGKARKWTMLGWEATQNLKNQ